MKTRALFRLFLLSILLIGEISAGQKTFNVASGNWGTAGNWSPVGIPAVNDTVTIPTGRTCTINVNASCASLVIDSGATAITRRDLTVQSATLVNGTISFPTTIGTKIFIGLITIGSTGTWNSMYEGFTIRGGITNYGSFISGNGTYIFDGNQSLTGNPITFNGNVTVSSGRTLTNNTSITAVGDITGNNISSTFVNAAGSELNAKDAVMSTGTLTATAVGNIVNYSRTGNQTIKGTTYYNLTLSASGTKTITGVTVIGKLSRQGTVTVTGTPTYGASAVLEYKGSAAQTTGAEFPAAMDNKVIINNINGVSLNSARTLNDSLILTSGNLTTTSANLLTIGSNGSISSGSPNSFVNGPLSKVKNTAAQETMLFPLGKGSAFRPLELIIQHTDTTASAYTAELFNTAPMGRTLPSSLEAVSSVRYWNITKTGGAVVSSAFIVLSYDADDGVSDPEYLRVAKDNATDWVDLGGTANGSPAGSILSGLFTSFSNFVLANGAGGSNPLPVELNSFAAKLNAGTVMLNWVTKTEISNFGFDIERSSSERNWTAVGFVKGHGNSNSPKEYSFIDKPLSPGKYMYRLKQIDADGSFSYSSIMEIIFEPAVKEFSLSRNFPNPFNPSTSIEYSVPRESFVELEIYDVAGNEVKTLVAETKSAGTFKAEFNASGLSSGIYIARIKAGMFTKSIKMNLIK